MRALTNTGYRAAGAGLLLAAAILGGCRAGDRQSASADSARGSDTTVASAGSSTACAPGNGGIQLPAGFCATAFFDSAGGPRHITVASNGDVFAQLISTSQGPESGTGTGGGVLALRDTNKDGRADSSARFGVAGGTGIALYDGYLYSDEKDRIVRFPLAAGSLIPSGPSEVVVSGLPTGGHGARNMAIDSSGVLYVNVGSRENSCQERDRQLESPGRQPCTGLQTRAGIWKFDAHKTNQRFSPAQRWATGIRNAMGLTINPADGKVYTTQHGRDQLYQNWPKLYTAKQGAENPAEEFMQVNAGDDFGWPYCYFSVDEKKLVLAPEYGGDGTKVGLCAQKKAPLVYFPGHWAPESSLFYSGSQFPEHYRGGVFIAFHGSWNRAPEPQAGYKVVFVPFSDGKPSGDYETFADGFAGEHMGPNAAHRPVGLAQGPDGALYITDDTGGRIWKVTYTGAR